MEKYVYIKKNIAKHYIDFATPLSSDEYFIGETWEDYCNNKWVLLSDEQLAFKEEHPTANVQEVWNMQMTPVPERTLRDAKNEMIATITGYDDSNAVNEFIVTHEGQVVTTDWFEPNIRANYKNSVESAELVGLQNVLFYVGDMPITLPTQDAKLMLAQIQLYADACYIVTKQHISAVEALESIEDVDAYDYESGYPNKLSFAI